MNKNTRCAWLARSYLERDFNEINHIKPSLFNNGDERPNSKRAEKRAKKYISIDGKEFRAISALTFLGDNGKCGDMRKYILLGEVVKKE